MVKTIFQHNGFFYGRLLRSGIIHLLHRGKFIKACNGNRVLLKNPLVVENLASKKIY